MVKIHTVTFMLSVFIILYGIVNIANASEFETKPTVEVESPSMMDMVGDDPTPEKVTPVKVPSNPEDEAHYILACHYKFNIDKLFEGVLNPKYMEQPGNTIYLPKKRSDVYFGIDSNFIEVRYLGHKIYLPMALCGVRSSG